MAEALATVVSADPPASRSQALLQVAESVAHHRDLGALFHELAARLHRVAHFDYLNLVLYDAERQVMRLHILENMQPQLTHTRLGREMALSEAPSGLVFETQEPFVVADVQSESAFAPVMEMLRQEQIRSFCLVPLTTAQRKLGVIGFGKIEPHHYDPQEVEFMQQVARQVAVAVDNALNFEAAQAYQQQLARERDRLRVLLEVNNAIVSTLDPHQLFDAIAGSLRRVMQHEYTSLALFDEKTRKLRIVALDFPQGTGLIRKDLTTAIEEAPGGCSFSDRAAQQYTRADLQNSQSEAARLLLAEGVQTICYVPLITSKGLLGTLGVASRRESAFAQQDVDLLSQVGVQVAIAVENSLAFEEIAELRNKLAQEKLYLEDEIRNEYIFEEIVGESPVLKALLSQLQTVAPTGSTVLIEGETGTGKELVARAIHNLSPRRDRTFVKINCAAIPMGLLESELFGHERGAFTGAISQKLGRFEVADKGTLFLDEVGDIPPELQPKLLRVLQEQEFERLGSTRTRRVDVRVVAATNRDLGRLVAEGSFRSDLYYRLNVFPLLVPPLRERRDDISTLVRYFAQGYARRMNKHIETISAETLAALERYHWPGNVRELQNMIERAVILSPGNVLRVPIGELRPIQDGRNAKPSTLADAEREHILRSLEDCNWVLGGPLGAAVRLGLKRTTLQSRMQKLRISKPR